MPALIEKVPGFKKHIRVFIVHTLATTFQDSTRENMEQCLDLVSARRHARMWGRRVGGGGYFGACRFGLHFLALRYFALVLCLLAVNRRLHSLPDPQLSPPNLT